MDRLGESVVNQIEAIKKDMDLQGNEQKEFFEITSKRNENYMKLCDNFEDFKQEQIDTMAKHKTEVSQMLVA